MHAEVRLEGNQLVAVLSNGCELRDGSVRGLASPLRARGLNPSDVMCGDWREGDHVLTSGQKIALNVALRSEGPGSPLVGDS